VEVESTTRSGKERVAGFEDREGHRTPFASARIIPANSDVRLGGDSEWELIVHSWTFFSPANLTIPAQVIHGSFLIAVQNEVR
jgi:hypothetical protein